jgi:hypothetical protein
MTPCAYSVKSAIKTSWWASGEHLTVDRKPAKMDNRNMSSEKPDDEAAPPSIWWRFSLFEWIDKQPSESKRRVFQNIVSYSIWAAIAATFTFIVVKRYWIIDGSKSIWNFLQSPILLQIWSILLIVISVVWNFYMLRKKTSDKLLIAEIQKLKAQISEQTAQDPRFMEVIKYIIDDYKAKGLKYIIEHSIGSIDKAVPLILKSNSFDEFMANAGITLDVTDSVQLGFAYPQMNGQMSFGVAAMGNPLGTDMATFVIEKNKVIHMNNAAHSHYDWSYITFKKKFDIDFETHKEKVSRQKEIAKAAIAIHKQLIPILNSWEDCTVLIEDSAEKKLKKRQATFQTQVNVFWAEFEEKKLLMSPSG